VTLFTIPALTSPLRLLFCVSSLLLHRSAEKLLTSLSPAVCFGVRISVGRRGMNRYGGGVKTKTRLCQAAAAAIAYYH